MIVYSSNKSEFIKDVHQNQIENRILEIFKKKNRFSVSKNEVYSWKNSMQYMANIVSDEKIPPDVGVAIEYTIPQTSKRIDFILTGMNDQEKEVVVIVELKQWERVRKSNKDAIVETYISGAEREVAHPSYQAWTYAALLEDFNTTIQNDCIQLKPCAYLHNCLDEDVILHEAYREHTDKAPAFLKKDTEALRRFIRQFVTYGDKKDTLYRIEHGKIRPSKSLVEHLSSLLEGNKEFLMIDDQKLIYESALELSEKASQTKQVMIVEGGPGTGKSVLAINLLVDFTKQGKTVHYVTKNSAPREVYQRMLSRTMTKTRIANLFKGSGAYTETDIDAFDVLVVDEAHRLNEKSGLFRNIGQNQIKEIIKSAKCSIFFIDENQKVALHDIGEKNEIKRWAKEFNAEVSEGYLASQFRCNGSDGYLAWLDQVLQIRKTANDSLEDIDYQFEVLDSPADLKDKIFSLNIAKNKSRMVAGYCWDWVSKKKPELDDIVFDEYSFSMPWNLADDGMTWILQEGSVKQVGCIHTCQGLELDYVGVIVGPDLLVRDGRIVTDGGARSKNDSTVRGYKKLLKEDPEKANEVADQIIKNTYRTLMTRGAKGCFIWCVDSETNDYFKEQLKSASFEVEQPIRKVIPTVIPFPLVPKDKLEPFINAVPLFDLKAAAGEFSSFQEVHDFEWVELPEPFSMKEGYFILQVVGESMNKTIPNKSWCLFKVSSAGSREGKTVLVQHRNIQDPDLGGSFTVKKYHSEKVADQDTEWKHSRIVLSPNSTVDCYQDIVLEDDEISELRVVGEFLAVLC